MPCMPGTQSPERLDGFFGSGDDDRVKTEKKPGERGRDRPEENPALHTMLMAELAVG